MSGTLPIIAAILVLGIAAQLVARRLRIPSVLFLIFIGLALGEAGLEWVTFATFGEGIDIIVGLSLSIIIFDGAFHLHLDRLREASRATIRLVTIGAALTLAGTALAVRLFVGADWATALLVGALLVATGPTVITPVLETVRVREHIASLLESEGIINDVTAAIAAVVVFDLLVVGDGGIVDSVAAFGLRLGVGVATGLIVAGGIHRLIQWDITPRRGPQTARFLLLVAAVGSYGAAELFAPESGIAAAATAGFVLGNRQLGHRETMKTFGRDTTLVVLSFVFISLAALIDVEAITALGLAGIGVVIAVTLIVRPVVIWLSTIGLERYTTRERLFLSAVGPRGIIPASVATLFAVELIATGDPEAGAAAQTLLGSVFIVIFATVVLEAGLARQIGDVLGVTPMKTIIVGGGRVGRALATRLENRGEYVIIIEQDEAAVDRTRAAGFTVHVGDGTETAVLEEAGVQEAKIVATTTADDDSNLLVCQLARSKFDVPHIYARVNDPDNVPAFESIDVTAIDAPMATAYAIDNEIERPALAHWLNDMGEDHDVQEVEVTSKSLDGKTIRDVNADIPDGCIIATIGREGETHVPNASDTIEQGDHLTFIGNKKAVKQAIKRFHPHN